MYPGPCNTSYVPSAPYQPSLDTEKTMVADLDPISILANVALLQYQPTQTRIGFRSSKVKVQNPSEYTYLGINFQGAVRWFNGEGREDLKRISKAINFAGNWFFTETEEMKACKTLLSEAFKGLTKLQETYQEKKSGLAPDAIEKWKDQITNLLKQELHKPELNKATQKVKNLWPTAKIEDINSFLSQMSDLQGDTSPNDEIKCLDEIKLLELLLDQKAKALNKIYEESKG